MTRKRRLKAGIALLAGLSALAVGWLVFLTFIAPQSGWRLPDQWQGQNLNHPSTVGQEILDGAVSYIDTNPRYDGSKIFAGGVPTDGTGVCTDVVWYGAKAAGMDLRTLVDEDRHADPAAYAATAPAGEQPNADIDYRRVRNLIVYFNRHAQALTTDKSDIEAWQPGDIAVFREHVGVISDRRGADGVPFVIHHEGGLMNRFEKDVLNEREILGHYRLG